MVSQRHYWPLITMIKSDKDLKNKLSLGFKVKTIQNLDYAFLITSVYQRLKRFTVLIIIDLHRF